MDSCTEEAGDIFAEQGENFTEEIGKNSSYLCLLGRLRRTRVRAYLQALRSGFSPTHHSCCWAKEKARPRLLFSIR